MTVSLKWRIVETSLIVVRIIILCLPMLSYKSCDSNTWMYQEEIEQSKKDWNFVFRVPYCDKIK